MNQFFQSAMFHARWQVQFFLKFRTFSSTGKQKCDEESKEGHRTNSKESNEHDLYNPRRYITISNSDDTSTSMQLRFSTGVKMFSPGARFEDHF